MDQDTQTPTPAPDVGGYVKHELERLKADWIWFLLLGIGLVVLGTVAIGATLIVGLVTVVLFGVLLLLGGVAQVTSAFWAGRWSGFLVHLLVGVFYAVVGLLIIDAPEEALATLTLLVAAFLIVGGIFRIAGALTLRFSNWGWVLLNGVVTLLLGILIYRQWPASAEFAIGLFVGIEMIFNGWTWIALSLGLKHLNEETKEEVVS
jgi:uncharacterized membrane protein HdeD (DUF308 family)